MGIYVDALFSKTQQRVLALLFGNADRSFYANEIISLAGSGVGAVQRELARLADASLVSVTKIGNQKHYQANREAPIFEELQSIVKKTFGLADELRLALQPMWPQVEVAFVYGSIAKGSEHSGSDIDLMVIGKSISNAELLAALAPAERALGRTVNPTLYSVEEFAQRVKEQKSFIMRVLEQPKIFVKGLPHDLARLAEGAGESGQARQAES
jgi:predicted nucleotidyltransferase